MKIDDLENLRLTLREFARRRDWERFHNPKDLAMALAVEAGELLENFLWMRPEASNELEVEHRERVSQEIADVLIYTVRLADTLGIDLLRAASAKVDENAAKYPEDMVRGKALKYTEYPR